MTRKSIKPNKVTDNATHKKVPEVVGKVAQLLLARQNSFVRKNLNSQLTHERCEFWRWFVIKLS